MTVNNSVCKLQLWDTAGQERFGTMTNSFYKHSHGVVLAYDITDRDSFIKIHTWKEEVDKCTKEDSTMMILVGCKNDLENRRAVS